MHFRDAYFVSSILYLHIICILCQADSDIMISKPNTQDYNLHVCLPEHRVRRTGGGCCANQHWERGVRVCVREGEAGGGAHLVAVTYWAGCV